MANVLMVTNVAILTPLLLLRMPSLPVPREVSSRRSQAVVRLLRLLPRNEPSTRNRVEVRSRIGRGLRRLPIPRLLPPRRRRHLRTLGPLTRWLL
jgi:hypothetical protein